MFTVNHQTNRISPVKTKKYRELGFTERKHLQEWLAHEPSALGEELLIIQKELRVELWISRGVTEENKYLFDLLSQSKQNIEHTFGAEL